jgi:hypothetical protein
MVNPNHGNKGNKKFRERECTGHWVTWSPRPDGSRLLRIPDAKNID